MAKQEKTSAIDQDLIEVEQNDKLKESFEQLFSDNNLEKITDLNMNEIGKISVLKTYAVRYGFTELNNLITNFLKLRVSKKREGRKESVKVASANILREENLLRASFDYNTKMHRGK